MLLKVVDWRPRILKYGSRLMNPQKNRPNKCFTDQCIIIEVNREDRKSTVSTVGSDFKVS